jgi:hypothetical protein
MNIPLASGLLLIRGETSFFLIGRATEQFALPIETTDAEVFQGVREGDLIVVSAPEGGEVEQARMLLELVRTYHAPLVVLPKGHPGSRRLRMVISAGPVIRPHSTILRGTHPEQDVICSSPEFDGVVFRAVGEGVEAEGLPAHAHIRPLP